MGDAARAIAGTTVWLGVPVGAEAASWVPAMLRDIIVEVAYVDPDAVVPTARLARDLGMD